MDGASQQRAINHAGWGVCWVGGGSGSGTDRAEGEMEERVQGAAEDVNVLTGTVGKM